MAIRNPNRSKFKPEVSRPKLRDLERHTILSEKAMLVRLQIGRWYGAGSDDQIVGEIKTAHAAQGDIGTFRKRFMSRERLAGIQSVVSEARRYHKDRTLPWEEGARRLLPADLFFEYKKEMTAIEMRFNQVVEEFLEKYPDYIEVERKRLNGLFKDRDYPSVDELRERYRFVLDVSPLPRAEDFRVDLGEDEIDQIRKGIEARVAEAARDATTALWFRLEVMVTKIRDRLEDQDSKVRSTLFAHLSELVAALPSFNIIDDPDLRKIAERVQKELLEASTEEIKHDPVARSSVAAKATKILSVMQEFTKGEVKDG